MLAPTARILCHPRLDFQLSNVAEPAVEAHRTPSAAMLPMPRASRAPPSHPRHHLAGSCAITYGKSQLMVLPSLDRAGLCSCAMRVHRATRESASGIAECNAVRCDNCGGGPNIDVGRPTLFGRSLRRARRTCLSAICHGPRRCGVLNSERGSRLLDMESAMQCKWSYKLNVNSAVVLRLQKMAIKSPVRTRVRPSAVITVTATHPNRRTPPINVANP